MSKKNKPSGSYSKDTVKKQKTIIGVLVLGLCAVLVIVGLGAGLGWFAPVPTTPTTPTVANATFTLIDYRTGEDVTSWVEISVWTPDPDDLPFTDEDPYSILNFDETVTSEDADAVSIDLTSHAVVWVEIDPDFESDYGGYNGIFNALATRDMRKLPGTGGSVNYAYTLYVYHAPSNVSVAMLNRGDMDSTDGSGADIGDMRPYNNTFVPLGATSWNRGESGNYTIFLNMPLYSADGLHAGIVGGDEWDIDDEELADMTQAEIAWLEDQSNFRTIAPYYDLTDDAEDDYVEDLEKLTNAFAIRFNFNTTISTTDGAGTQVNFSVSERDSIPVPVEVVYDGSAILFVFYEPIVCYDNNYNFDVELEIAAHIFLANATTCRIVIPEDDDNLGAATTLNNLFIDLYDQYAA